MAEHDFRYSMLNPQHTLTECRTLAPGRYQVTGNGGSIHDRDELLVTIKGSKPCTCACKSRRFVT